MTPEPQGVQLQPEAVFVPAARMMLGGISHSAFYALMKKGLIRTAKVGGRRVVPVDAIRELLQRPAA
jgi:hypothetical protein